MLSIKLIDQLFVRFQSNYGNKFSSQFPNENMIDAAKKEWGYALCAYDGEVFSYAIMEMQEYYCEWPPTIGQFIELCKMYYTSSPVIDPPKIEKGNAIIGNEALKEMRKSLGNKKND